MERPGAIKSQIERPIKEDLEVAVKKLRNAISNLNKEGREKLLKAKVLK